MIARIRALLAEYRALHDGQGPWRSVLVDGAVAAAIAVDVLVYVTVITGGHS